MTSNPGCRTGRQLAGVASLLISVALASCAKPDGVWRVTQIDGRPTPERPVATIQFGDGHLHGSAGCNGYSGRYRVFACKIWISQLSGKAQLCFGEGAAGMALEARVSQALAGASRFRRAGDRALVLDGSGHTLLLVKTAPS